MPQKKVVIPRLKLADTEIESVVQFNFLGITLDNHLNGNAHINQLFGKITRPLTPCNKVTSPVRSLLLSPVGDRTNSEVPL